MDAKKLQALQQQAGAHKKFPLAYQTNINDYHTATHSPVFSQHQQHTAPHQLAGYQLGGFQQSPTATSSSGGPLTPIDLQPQSNNKLLLKHVLAGNNSSSSSHSSPYHQSYTSSGIAAGSSDMYQSPSERTYMTSAGRTANPASALQQQYQQLQQAKLQLQLQTQNEAMQQQQRTFALRQALNPPVPQSHYHMSQSSSIVSTLPQDQLNKQHSQQAQQQQQQQQQHQRAPPSSLNLASQFQPAPGPLKMQQQRAQQQQQQQHYQQDVHTMHGQQQVQQQLQLQLQHQQQLQQQQQNELQQQQQHHHLHKVNEQSPVYIQQNHPGHVVNQACQTQISAVKSKSLNQQQKATPSSEESSVKSPVHAPLDRKKSTGSVQALKSPIAKRPPASPVSLSGWLYKQGSEGLKVWRKRWFVLAEYCLYYYKGPEEEKLLGSILLPSYRVSACLPEDKIYRKFAFKCEHQNMRTYWLAAENGDAMVQWVRALTAATMMQAPSSSGDSDQTSQPSGSSSLNHSGDNSDSGIHTLKSQQSKGQVTPASENGAGNLSTTLNTSGEGNQPLYANAPPKPRRINDGGYSSPSPEHSIDAERKYQQQLKQQNMNVVRRSGIMSPNLHQQHMLPQKQHLQRSTAQQQQQPQPQQHHAIYDTRTGNVTTALGLQQPLQQYSVDNLEAELQQKMALSDEYSKSPPPPTPFNNYLEMEEQILRLQQQQQQQKHELSAGLEDIYGERELYMQKLIRQRHLSSHGNNERRTPDAYGRSKNRIFSDYEDIYNLAQSGQHAQAALLQEAASYRRPLSPPSYDSSKHMPGLSLQYAPHQLESQTSRIRPVSSIMRPHSADFLDFEARAEAAATTVENEISGLTNFSSPALKPDVLRTPRPKSSLDINRTADSVYYSEASYAEKMRKSALYLQSPPRNLHGQQNFINPLGNSGLHTIGYENPYERAYKRHELLNEMTAGDVQSVPRLSRGAAAGTAAHIRANSARPAATAVAATVEKQQAVQQQPPQLQAPVLSPSLPTQQIIQQNEQFLRSASARLPKRSGGFDEEYNNSTNNATTTTTTATSAVGNNSQIGNILSATNANSNIQPDGEKKREESMKRLLEWKQRMLQSPLTRKGVQQQQQQQQQNGNGISNNKMSSLSKLGSNPNILLSSTTVASGAFYNQANLNNVASNATGNTASAAAAVSGLQRSRSETQTNATYNSYSSDDEASISVRNVRNLPKGNLTVKPDASDVIQQQQQQKQQLTNLYYGKSTALADRVNSTETSYLPHRKTEHTTNSNGGVQQGPTVAVGGEYFNSHGLNHSIYEAHNGYAQQQQTKHAQERQPNLQPLRRVGSRAEIDMLERETSNQMRNRLRTADGLTRAESIQRLDYLKQHLLDLERQYERSKPVVNLVDNMVKLGSLYKNNDVGQQQRQTAATLDRLEYNQRLQERRQQLEQHKDWDVLSPNQQDLQSKVNQLYQLDQLLQKESGTLQHLQRNKDDLERALGGIRARIYNANETPMALEAAKKEQQILENELAHVHQLLSENSQKLEQTVAGNTRLEQELCLLRQKLKASRGSQNTLTNGWSNADSNDTAAKLESELKRVQNLVGDMQRQRQELSSAVRQLTENSNRLYHEIGNKESTLTNGYRKRSNSASWVETDLDSLKSLNNGLHGSVLSLATPLYIETNGDMGMDAYANDAQTYGKMSEFSAEDIKRSYGYAHYNGIDSEEFSDTNPFSNLTQQERQEIKTVRIVKRESERRHRDRNERSNGLSSSIQNLDHLLEEESTVNYQTQLNGFGTDDYAHNARTKSLPRDYTEPPKPRHHSKHYSQHTNGKAATTDAYRNGYGNEYQERAETHTNLNPLANAYFAKQLQQQTGRSTAQNALRQKTDSVHSLNKSISDLSPGPVFQSEAARQIMCELSAGSASEDTEKVVEKVPSQHKHRRSVPREKRRHYTAPNNVNIKAMENVQAENDMNRNNTNWRARDDLDMDLALRPRLNAPDVVRSALGQGEKISENTIDNLLLAPNKIVIPERYIPEKTPELSAEEKKRRQEKVESIKKMLAEAPISSANDNTETIPPSKLNAEKKQREHLLQLNQILAQQVMQMSKIVAGNSPTNPN